MSKLVYLVKPAQLGIVAALRCIVHLPAEVSSEFGTDIKKIAVGFDQAGGATEAVSVYN